METLHADIVGLQNKLKDHKMVFDTILEYTLAGYWDWMIQENTEYLSPTFKSMFGYADHEMPNTPEARQKIIHPEDLPLVFETYDKHIQSKGKIPYDNEVRYFHKDGSIVWVWCRGKVIEWDEEGKPIRMVGSHVDITPLKNSQEELQQLKKELENYDRRLAASSHINQLGSWEWDLATNLVSWDDTTCRLFKLTQDEFQGDYESWVQRVHPEDLPRVLKILEDVLENKKPTSYQVRILWPDGSIRHHESTAVLQLDKEGKPRKVVGTTWDATYEKQAKHLERQKALLLEERNKELEQFVYIASHDLQEPIRTIINYLQVIQEDYADSLDQHAQRFLGYIGESSHRITTLIQDLLIHSRIGKNQPIEEVDCEQLIYDLETDMQAAIKEHKARIQVSLLPKIKVYATDFRLLFQNLISNAIKFRHPKRIPIIQISARQKAQSWMFKVQDNGIGIAPEHKDKIFRIFQRLHLRNEYEGTGIGLAHCQKIVEAHGGKIWVESAVGQGSTFCFTIPFE